MLTLMLTLLRLMRLRRRRELSRNRSGGSRSRRPWTGRPTDLPQILPIHTSRTRRRRRCGGYRLVSWRLSLLLSRGLVLDLRWLHRGCVSSVRLSSQLLLLLTSKLGSDCTRTTRHPMSLTRPRTRGGTPSSSRHTTHIHLLLWRLLTTHHIHHRRSRLDRNRRR